ncbi:tungstate ABC transporter substrate-binding protein WtpA [Candidatus Bathyarchaeota archaeon]|nr:tungstate ABC transporter substrate-binding protein WtpA [Candidatus Bathyarchaeota archaeon]
MSNSVRSIIVVALVAVMVLAGGYYAMNMTQQEENTPVTLKVFHAGSLAVPLEQIKATFEADHPNVEVQLEPAGSVQCVQKVTELGELADVVASADYSLIPSMMMPDYASWYIVFARNEMTVAYAETSRYSDEITAENWYQILGRPDVKWGFSNPNLDPCGYRTPMVIQLAELEYDDDTIFDTLVQDHCALTVREEEGVYIIDSSMEDLQPDTDKISIRDKSVELVSLVQSGGLDYAFEYSSVAKQHGLTYLDLPASIDLSDLAYEDTYTLVKIEKTSGTSTGSPIVYGVTIPADAPNPEMAAEFIKYMINEQGNAVFSDLGQPPVTPGIVSDMDAVPETLKQFLSEQG